MYRLSIEDQAHIIDAYEREREAVGVGWGKCFCGCGEFSLLSSHTGKAEQRLRFFPNRFKRNHAVAQLTGKPEKYVSEDRGHDTPCWVWQLKASTNGYGHITVGGRTKLAHRHYYEMHKGKIPAGLSIDHLCRVRECVNPDHLEAVPMHVNQRRGDRTILSVELVEALKIAHKSGVELPVLETLTGIKRRTIQAAIYGENWIK